MTRTRRLLTGLAALAAVIVVVVGIPVGLVRYVGWPFPTSLPSLDEIRLALRSGVDPRLVVNTLAVVVWVAWAQLIVAFTYEAVAALRGLAASTAPVLPAFQATAARLVAAITLAAATLAPIQPRAAFAHPIPPVAVAVEEQAPAWSQPGTRQPGQQAAPLVQEDPDRPAVVVGRFDTLWSIADATLGDGRRWTELRDLNLGRATASGETITATTEHVPAGTRLQLPADATVHPNTHGKTGPDEVTVTDGDSFWRIAETTLARAWGRQPDAGEVTGYWTELVDINRDRLQPPYDPDLIYPGQVFLLPPVPDDPRPSPGSTGSPPGEVTVTEGDSFWRIAETTLTRAWGRQPDPGEVTGYWTELVDINRDRLQPPHDPNLIYPGQVFLLPPVPADPAVSRQPDIPDVQSSPAEVEDPSTEDHQATDTTRPDTTGRSIEDTTTARPATPEATPAEATGPQPAETPLQPAHPRSPHDEPSADDPSPLLPVAGGLAGLGILAAGVVALIDRLRRRQLRQRPPGTVPTPPPQSAAETENTLRAAAAPTATDLIDLALRSLAHQITDTHTPPPDVVGVHLSDNLVRVLLWNPNGEPPAGWKVDDNGHSWTLPTSIDPTHLHLLADTIPSPYPTLVTVGHDPGGQLLLNLEHAGAVQVTGDPDQVAAVCHTMVSELAASQIADIADVVCVGFGSDLAHLERVRTVDHLEEVLPLVEEKLGATSHQDSDPLQARLAPGGDAWAPLIIFDPAPEKPDQADRVLAAAHQGRAVSAIVGYPTGGQWRFHVADGEVTVHPLGHTYHRRDLTSTEQAAVADLTRTAMDTNGVPQPLPDQPPTHLIAQPVSPPRDDSADPADHQETPSRVEKPGVEVKTLGHVRVDGMTERFPEAKNLELVVYLALHRRGVEADTLLEALFPGRQPNPPRLHDIVYKARHTLGEDPDGNPYLSYVQRGLYTVSPHLGCDLERFTHHIEAANQADQTTTIRHLQTALELVERPPFSGIKKGYAWTHAEGIATHAIVTVDNAAHQLARLALDADQPDLVTWAARKGLTVSWACEECYRNLMRAAIHTHDPLALEAIWNELNTIVDDDQGPDADDWLEAETIELYEQHRPRRRRTG